MVGDSSVAYVHGDDLEVWYFPLKLPELNPLEGCWDRLKEWFEHRLVPDLPTLKEQIQRGFPTVEEPKIWNYLCPGDASIYARSYQTVSEQGL